MAELAPACSTRGRWPSSRGPGRGGGGQPRARQRTSMPRWAGSRAGAKATAEAKLALHFPLSSVLGGGRRGPKWASLCRARLRGLKQAAVARRSGAEAAAWWRPRGGRIRAEAAAGQRERRGGGRGGVAGSGGGVA
uniref:Uncharacterized protein n=1 Tax=Arundo donax TaxID=35708 RepID=A0A0A8XSN3_ARUDO